MDEEMLFSICIPITTFRKFEKVDCIIHKTNNVDDQ